MESGKKPACFKNRCDIQDIMQSEDSHELSRMVDAFAQVEALQDTRGFDSVISRIVKENGLNSLSGNTIIQLRSVVASYRSFKAKDGNRQG